MSSFLFVTIRYAPRRYNKIAGLNSVQTMPTQTNARENLNFRSGSILGNQRKRCKFDLNLKQGSQFAS